MSQSQNVLANPLCTSIYGNGNNINLNRQILSARQSWKNEWKSFFTKFDPQYLSIRSDLIGELKIVSVYSSMSEGRKDNFEELNDYNYVGVSFLQRNNL